MNSCIGLTSSFPIPVTKTIRGVMRQRNKVLETDSPTAKFLYTIIKQLDLKSIDWNKVASDLDVSNGHAARMRYSRFRQQMEGTTKSTRTKRKSKKDKTMEPPAEMQGIFPMAPPLMMPMEPINSSFQSNPFVKSEPGLQGNLNLQGGLFQYSPQSMAETSTQGQYYIPQDFASMQFQLASGMPSGLPSSSPAPSFFMNPYQSPGPSTSYPYSSPTIQSGFDLRDFEIPSSFMNFGPTITWEPGPSHEESPRIKVEEEQTSQEERPSSGSQDERAQHHLNRQDKDQQGLSHQDPNQQAPNQQAPNQQAPNQQAPNQQAPNQQAPNQQAPNQQAPNQQAPNQQAPNQQELNQQGLNHHELNQQDRDQQALSHQDLNQQDQNQQRPSPQGPSHQDPIQQDLSQQDLSQEGLSQQDLSYHDPDEQSLNQQGRNQQAPSHRDLSQQEKNQQRPGPQDPCFQDLNQQDRNEQYLSQQGLTQQDQDIVIKVEPLRD